MGVEDRTCAEADYSSFAVVIAELFLEQVLQVSITIS